MFKKILFIILIINVGIYAELDPNEVAMLTPLEERHLEKIDTNQDEDFIVIIDDVQFSTDVLHSIDVNSIANIKLITQKHYQGNQKSDVLVITKKISSHDSTLQKSLENFSQFNSIVEYFSPFDAYEYAVLLSSAYFSLNKQNIFINNIYISKKNILSDKSQGYFSVTF